MLDQIGDLPQSRQAVLLVYAFPRRFAAEQRRGSMSFTDDAIRAIVTHALSGNGHGDSLEPANDP